VDARGRYDAFVDRTHDARVSATDAGTKPMAAERFDFSGRYLLALQTPIAPATPLLFRLDATVSADLTQIGLVFQPLATDAAPEPRAPVGSQVSLHGVAYGMRGDFDAKLAETSVPGRANPISGSDIVATVELLGASLHLNGAPLLCGSALGKVTAPIALDLAGSQFGAVPAEDLTSVTPVTHCPDEAKDGG
jgi:hypothetical protein